MMQAGKDYGVRVIRAFGLYSVGAVVHPSGCDRDMLLMNGLVEEVKATSPDPDPETKRKPKGKPEDEGKL